MMLQSADDLRNHVHMDVLAPENTEMFVSLQAPNIELVF
jgi:hypothetical protein